MGLLGKAAVVIFSDYPKDNQQEHSKFHSYEHLIERVETEGFVRGRRCNALSDDSPHAFALYEVVDRAVTQQGEYIDKLNNPTPWTNKFRPLQTYASRTLCEVVASVGWGTGSKLLSIRFAPVSGREAELRDWVVNSLIPSLAPDDSRIAVHFLVRDASIKRPLTQEEIICAHGAGSLEAAWILLVEGWDESALRILSEGVLGQQNFVDHGAQLHCEHDLYGLSHVLTHAELSLR